MELGELACRLGVTLDVMGRELADLSNQLSVLEEEVLGLSTTLGNRVTSSQAQLNFKSDSLGQITQDLEGGFARVCVTDDALSSAEN